MSKTPPRRLTLFVFSLLSLFWWACADSSGPAAVEPQREPVTAQAVEVTYEPTGFAWLQPLVEGTPAGPLATGLALEVSICDLDQGAGNVGCETLTAVEMDGLYQAEWNTEKDWKDHLFEISAKLNGAVIGSLEVVLERGGSEQAGRTLPVKFWVGDLQSEVDCVGDDRCNVGGVAPGSQSPTVIEARDENNKVIAVLSLPAGSAPVPLNVILDCREDGYNATEGPLPTDLDQWPLFCRVDAREPGAEVEWTGPLNSAATIEICVIDEAYNPNYHSPLDHTELFLGKSPSGTGDSAFEYLPQASTPNLPNCDDVQLTADAVGLLDRLWAPVDGLLRLVGPQPLNATMFRRDGGVGGTLTAFSDINPVSPAYIEGSIFGGAGATVMLSGGGLALQTTADGNGGYSFGPLPVPVGGVTYNVQVGSLNQDVSFTGSGTEQADFVLQGSLVLSGFKTIYDEAVINGVGTVPNAPGPIYTSGYPYGPCSALSSEVLGGTGGWLLGPNNDTGSVVTLTKDILVPVGTTSIEILGWVDNDAKVLVGTEDITASAGTPDATGFVRHENCANLNPLMFEAGDGQFNAGAVNTFTFIVRDRGTIGYADFQVTAVAGSE